MKSKHPYQLKMLNRTTDYYRRQLAEHILANQRRTLDLLDTTGFQRGMDRLAVKETLERQSRVVNTRINIDKIAA